MTTVSYHFEAPTRIMPTAVASPVAQTAKDAAQVSSRKEVDWEERRWQLEWDRRNVED
jgi:hypothetical protein